MTRITDDDFRLIGLHKMAAERGDGLVPELLALIRDRRESFDGGANVVHFPETGIEASPMRKPASNENNVIAFPLQRRGVR